MSPESVEPDTDDPITGEPLPDLSALKLVDLRTLQHPVLREVLEDLRERAARPGDVLWGYGSAF